MHDLKQYSDQEIHDRIHGLIDVGALWNDFCICDDFEVEDMTIVRHCPWNDPYALEAELARREIEASR